jgi:hypothetical protein
VKEASLPARFKHYSNIDRMQSKLAAMLAGFVACDFVTCSHYLGRHEA